MSSNANNNKRIAKNTIFLYFRSILLLLISLYTSRVTLEVLGVEDFGIYQIVGGVVSMFSMLSSTLASASQRFITFALGENDYQKQRRVFSTCISLHIVLGLIVVVLLEVLGIWFLNNKLNIPVDRLAVAGWVMQFSIATFFVNIVSVPYNATIIAHEEMSAFAYISILEGLLKLGSVFLLMVISWDKLLLYSALYFLIALFLRVIYSVYSNRQFKETRSVKFSIDKELFRGMFAFAGWNLFGNGSLVLRNQGVDVVLNMFFGVVVNAAKGVSNQVQSAVQQFVGNFTTAIKPQLTIAIAQKDYQRAYALINKGSRYSFLMMMLFSIPIIISAPQILEVWLTKVPDYSVLFVRWTFIYLLLDSLSRMMIHAILSEGRIKEYQIVVGGTKLFAIPLVYIMLLLGCNPLAGVWANILLELICLIERMYYSKKLLNLDWKYFIIKVVFRCWVVFIFAISIPYLFICFVSQKLLITVAVSLIWTLAVISLTGVDKSERNMIFGLLKKKIVCRR